MLDAYEKLTDGALAYRSSQAANLRNPVGVGGVGGSGTRVLAQVLGAGGVDMGTPLNKALDTMEWPPLRALLAPAVTSKYPADEILRNALHEFEKLLIARRSVAASTRPSGWKVPGTFLWLRELAAFFPELRYVHLIRSGLDMAYSSNQAQVPYWAERLGVDVARDEEGRILPRVMLEVWLRGNDHTLRTAAEHLPDRMLVVRYEDLCGDPATEIRRLFAFLAMEPSESQIESMAKLVEPPTSIGRYREFDWRRDFSDEQLGRLEALGYVP